MPRSALDVLTSLNERVASGGIEDLVPIATGFVPMDKTIGGGLRPGELMLIGGAQGQGKTTMALQMARNMAASGQATALYVCFEHDEEYLIQRMVAMESALTPPAQEVGRGQDPGRQEGGRQLVHLLRGDRHARQARRQPTPAPIPRADRPLRLATCTSCAAPQRTRPSRTCATLVQEHRGGDDERRLVLFVDYLQKVPVIPEPSTEEEKVTRIVSGLKDIALAEMIPVVAIVAADREGLKAKRLRNHHLRGISAINYESRHHPDPERQVQHRRQGQHRVQPVPGAALPRLGGCQRSRRTVAARTTSTSSTRSSSSTAASIRPAGSTAEKLIEERLYND